MTWTLADVGVDIAGVGAMIEQIKEFQKDEPGYEGYLSDRVAALPELLRDAGYLTMMSGKWHLGLTSERWPCKRGFNKSFSLLPGAANHYGYEPQMRDDDKEPKILAETKVWYVEDDKPVTVDGLGSYFYSTDAFTNKMLHFLQDRTPEEKGQPFFGYLAYSAPHWPLQAPEEDRLDYRGVYDDGPDSLRQRRLDKLKELGLIPRHAKPHNVVVPPIDRTLCNDWEALTDDEKKFSSRTMEVYAAMVQNMDKHIGRVLDHLRSTDELDNTLILFMSDNGAEGLLLEAYPVIESNIFDHVEKYYNNSLDNIGNKDSYVWYGPRWASAATAPARLYKSFNSEGGIRVPMMIRYPPFTASRSGAIDHSFVTVMDIAPTLLELAETQHPGKTYKSREVVPMRGRSWVTYMTNPEREKYIHDDDTVTGWELFDRQALRKGKWKAILIPPPFGPGSWQLYDLSADPGETEDLCEQEPKKLQELLKHWDEYVKECGVAGQAPQYGVLKVQD